MRNLYLCAIFVVSTLVCSMPGFASNVDDHQAGRAIYYTALSNWKLGESRRTVALHEDLERLTADLQGREDAAVPGTDEDVLYVFASARRIEMGNNHLVRAIDIWTNTYIHGDAAEAIKRGWVLQNAKIPACIWNHAAFQEIKEATGLTNYADKCTIQ